MFAKYNGMALCVVAYGSLQKGAIIPAVNELYSEVEEWRKDNEWAEIPDGFFDIEPTEEEQRNKRAIAYADPTTGSDRLLKDYQGAALLDASEDELSALKEAWEKRLLEIKEEFPITS